MVGQNGTKWAKEVSKPAEKGAKGVAEYICEKSEGYSFIFKSNQKGYSKLGKFQISTTS